MVVIDETIAAPATATGSGLRAIIRVSGPATRKVVEHCFIPDDPVSWRRARKPRRHSGRLKLPEVAVPLPAKVSLWPTGRSYTGQPLAELHLAGSPPLVEALLEALYAGGARAARRGEFTLRAFLAGRIDLVQAEAVLGVIDADDAQHLRQALSQLAGGISTRIGDCREQLLLHLADLEAGLDFVEEDLEFVDRSALLARLDGGLDLLRSLLVQTATRMHTTGRRTVSLLGLPNAGKSTLFNALAGREAAIVSPERGTTRDVLTQPVEWEGLGIDLCDTAGWEEARDAVMRQAEEQRTGRLQRADLLLWCTPHDLPPRDRAADVELFRACPAGNALRVMTKCDDGESAGLDLREAVPVSARTGFGLDRLRETIVLRLRSSGDEDGELIGATAARCGESLRRSHAALERAKSAALSGAPDELLAIELREGVDALGEICGAVYTDDILDRIFSRFCIGK